MRFSYLSHLECPRDGRSYDAGVPQKVCECGSPLLARYDLGALAKEVSPRRDQRRPAFAVALPPAASSERTRSGCHARRGFDPHRRAPEYGAQIGVPRLVVKDEGLLPTGSFKGRGAAVGVSRARELGITAIAMPTNGNAGAAWATYAARAGMAALIVMPVDAPEITRKECVVTGAQLYLVDGLIGDAGRIVERAVARDGWFPVATLKEPYRLEGKKTMGFEIAEQLGWRVPDVIVYPTGGGVGLIGIYKALLELRSLAGSARSSPAWSPSRQVAAPRSSARSSAAPTTRALAGRRTVAFGINVPSAIGDFLILDAVRSTGVCRGGQRRGDTCRARRLRPQRRRLLLSRGRGHPRRGPPPARERLAGRQRGSPRPQHGRRYQVSRNGDRGPAAPYHQGAGVQPHCRAGRRRLPLRRAAQWVVGG